MSGKNVTITPAVYYKADVELAGKPYITVYPNQRVVQLHKNTPSIDFTAHNYARANLSSSAFIIYDYLVCHSNKWIWTLSPELIKEKTNIGRTTYLSSMKELISKGYIVEGKIDTGEMLIEKNAYHIYEHPVEITNA